MKYIRVGLVLFSLFVGLSLAAPPKNVIILIGDGMGFEQVKAAGMYANGAAGTLSFESLPYKAQCTTYSANSSVTDSAAAATAIATGHKVNNGVISVALPGDGSPLQTLLEYFKAQGKSTGLVTTVYIEHATPAGFGAHETSRNNNTSISNDYLTQTKPNVLMGGAAHTTSSAAIAAGYTVVTNRTTMQSLNSNSVTYLAGQFGSDYMPFEYDGMGALPHLREMATTAIDVLDNDPDGFFLMVEGGMIDTAGHSNDLYRNIGETVEFSNAAQVVLDWAAGRTDTLVVVTADHETGGLTVTQNNGQGVYPTVTWSTKSHTAANVPVYAIGVNAERIHGTLDNTDFFDICTRDEFPADLDGDLQVDLIDFSRIASQWQAGMEFSDLQALADSWLSGIARFALWFDGVDDYVEIPGFQGIPGSTNRSCCAWIKTTKSGDYSHIMSWGASVNEQAWMIFLSPNGKLNVSLFGGGITGTVALNDGNWHHIAVVLEDDLNADGRTWVEDLQLYVDGNADPVSALNTGSNPEAQVDTSSDMNITLGVRNYGDHPLGYSFYFDGQIDEVRIYDRALSDVEISSIANTQDGLVAYWNLNEGSGDMAYDSVSGYTGTIYGSKWFPGK